MKTAKELLEALKPIGIDTEKDIDPEVFSLLEDVAKEFLHIDTLKTQNSDEKDFHDCSVWSIAEALYNAYEHGRAAAEQEIEEIQ